MEGEEVILAMTVRNCLEKANELKLTSIALPAIRYDNLISNIDMLVLESSDFLKTSVLL
jgi:hypothetical protein